MNRLTPLGSTGISDQRIVRQALFGPSGVSIHLGYPKGAFAMCSVEGCEDQVLSRGWCNKHYKRWRNYGDPNVSLVVRHQGSPVERFWAKVQKTEACWLWQATIDRYGYGRFAVSRKQLVGAHRFSFEQVRGPIPEGLVLDHLCRVRHCVNPSHLEPVTQKENSLRGDAPNIVLGRMGMCKYGHAMTPANTIYRTRGHGKRCRECVQILDRKRKRAKS